MPSICQPYHIYLYTPHVHQDPMIPHMSQLGYSRHGGVFLRYVSCSSLVLIRKLPAFFQATSSSRFGQRFGDTRPVKSPVGSHPKMVVEGLGGNPSQHVRTKFRFRNYSSFAQKIILVQVIFGILLPSYVEIEKKKYIFLMDHSISSNYGDLTQPPKTPHIRGLVSGNIFWNFRGG